MTPSTPEQGVNCWFLRSKKGLDIATIDGPQNNETEADARLIAAAPDLLEALQLMLSEVIFTDTAGTDAAHAVLTKATGVPL